MTRAKSYDQDAEESAHFLIQPDPRCPECATIMDWRSAHRWIAITNGAEIRLSDNPLGIRHLHVRNLRVAHQKNRQLKEWERKERFTLWRSPVVLVAKFVAPFLRSSALACGRGGVGARRNCRG